MAYGSFFGVSLAMVRVRCRRDFEGTTSYSRMMVGGTYLRAKRSARTAFGLPTPAPRRHGSVSSVHAASS